MTQQNPFGMGLGVMRQLGASQGQIRSNQGELQRQQMVQAEQQRLMQDQQAQAAAAQAEAEEAERKQFFDLLSNVRQLPTAEARIQALQTSPFAQAEDFADFITPQTMSDEGLDQILAASPYAQRGADDFNIGQFNPRDYTPDSFAQFLETRDPNVLQSKQKYDTVKVGGTDYRFNPSTGEYDIPVVPSSGGDTEELTPEVQTERKTGEAAEIAEAETEARERTQRGATIIQEGMAQARTIPTLKQTISLLDQVETGGWTNQLKQAVKRSFGIESADEGVLTANLGKAVLSQLRQTFGAAFTEREGARLERIEANFGKSAATNKALLRQVLELAMKDAQAALDRATADGDTQTANEIREFMNMSFDLGGQGGSEAQPLTGTTGEPLPFNLEDGTNVRGPDGTIYEIRGGFAYPQ